MESLAAAHPRALWLGGASACLVIVFFLATHDPLAALQWQQTLPEEVRALVSAVSEGRMQRQVAFPILGAAGVLALLLQSPLRSRPHALLCGLLGAFLVWPLLSVLWSADPLLTGKRLLVLVTTVAGAAGLVRQLAADGLLRMMAVITAVFLAFGVAAELWLGVLRWNEAGYRFAGTLHPNQQGINCALLALAASYLIRVSRTRRGRAASAMLLMTALTFLLLTRSRTALVACVIALLLFLVIEAPPLRRAAMVAMATAFVALLLLLQSNGVLSSATRILLLGREDSSLATFTGRTEIWSYALRHAAARPILGHGYNSFWSPRHTAEVSRTVDWKISEGHSAYVDVMVNLGVVGLMLFVALMSTGVMVALRRHRQGADPALGMVASLLLLGMLDGILESAVVIPSFLSFVTLAALTQLAWRGGSGASPWPWPVRPTGLVAARHP